MAYRIASAHSGADFEAGRLGHRNGEQVPGTEHDVSDGTQPEQMVCGTTGTGLAQRSASSHKVRKPSKTLPARMGPVWRTVTIVGKERETNPQVKCNDCGKTFCGGLQRVEDHIIKACSCSSPELEKLKADIVQKRVDAEKARERKAVAQQVQRNADEVKPTFQPPVGPVVQRSIQASLATGKSSEMDAKIAEFVYGDCLPPAIVESPRFRYIFKSKDWIHHSGNTSKSDTKRSMCLPHDCEVRPRNETRHRCPPCF